MMLGGGFAVCHKVAVTVRLIDVGVDPKLNTDEARNVGRPLVRLRRAS